MTTPTKTKSLNENLHKSKTGKNDEFYTQITDIENELKHYKEHFKGKVVFCNCDDPKVSNFFRYFFLKFHVLELKELVATCYKNQNADIFSLNDCEQAVYLDFDGTSGNTEEDLKNIETKPLKGSGDFRSDECIELLKQADIVVTNPPFSLFREYVAQLVEHDKKFVIVGNQNAITYKDIFKLIKENKLWLGRGFSGGAAHFINKHYVDYATAGDHKEGMIRVSGVVWFTNLELKKRHENLILYKTYYGNESDYPHYENYDAINVDKTKDIPVDYEGVIGVPITFLDKYNPDQFELVGMCENLDLYGLKTKVYTSAECKNAYFDKFGKKGTYDLNASGVVIRNGLLEKVYQRVLIKHKNPTKL